MFSFFKEYDENIYAEIVGEVQQTLSISLGYTAVASAIEKILKPICTKELNLESNNQSNQNITLGFLIRNEEVQTFLVGIFGLNSNDINRLKQLNKMSNMRKHETSFVVKNKARENFKLLYDVCFYAYKYRFKKYPDSFWDEDYVDDILNQAEQMQAKVEKLEEQIKSLSMPISRIELPEYVAQNYKPYKYIPKQKLINVGNKTSKKVKVSTQKQPQLKKIGSQYQIDLSKNQNLEIIFDYIQRGWFLQAAEQLNSFKENGEVYYLKLLCENKCKNIDEFLKGNLRAKIENCDKLIATAPQNVAKDVVEKLMAMYEKSAFSMKQQIFSLLSKYNFEQRSILLESFNNDIVNAINSDDFEIDSEIVVKYVESIQTIDNNKLRELIELCIQKEKFNIARDLNNLILKKEPKDIYALSKQLLIECEVKNEDSLQDALQNLKDLSIVEDLLFELSNSNSNLFLVYVDIILNFIKTHQTPENAKVIFNLFMTVYKYNIKGREQLKQSVFQYLLSILNTQNNIEIFEYFETILTWAVDGEEFVRMCEQIAVQCLNCDIKDDRFLNMLKDAQGKTFLVLKLMFYGNHGLAFNNTKPFKSSQKVNKIAFNTLMKSANTDEQQEILKDIVKGLVLDLKNSDDTSVNYKLFNYFVSYFSAKDIKFEYETMLLYVRELLKVQQWDKANTILRQMLSMEYRQYEILMYMLVCEYKTDSIEGLLNFDEPIINNNLYDMAIKSSYIKDKEAYNYYLDLYSKQNIAIGVRQQKKQQEIELKQKALEEKLDKRRVRILNCIFSIIPLCVLVLSIALAIILHSGIGSAILAGMFGVMALVMFFVLISPKQFACKVNKIKKFKAALIASVLISVIAITSTAAIITAVNNSTHRFNVVYDQYHCSADIGRNYNIKDFKVNDTNGSYSVLSVSIKCPYNNYIESIIIPEGVKSMTECDFSDCANLRKIVIPSSIGNISLNTFSGTRRYTIYFRGTEAQFRKAFTYSYIPLIGNRIVFNYSGVD